MIPSFFISSHHQGRNLTSIMTHFLLNSSYFAQFCSSNYWTLLIISDMSVSMLICWHELCSLPQQKTWLSSLSLIWVVSTTSSLSSLLILNFSLYFCDGCSDACCPLPRWCNTSSLKNAVNTKVNLRATRTLEATRWFPSITSPRLFQCWDGSPVARKNFVYVHFCSSHEFSERGLQKAGN